MEGLINAFIYMKEKHKDLQDYKLVLVGGINNQVFQKTTVSNVVKGRKDIIFAGYVSDEELRHLYSKAEIFVLVSKFEGFGIPPLEAMSCGTPVVVSNVASLPEVCGEAAVYVNPYSVEDIAKGIYSLLKDENLKKNLIEKGFKRVKIFSWEKTTEKILSLIDRFS
ncbi:MAG: glycosyltransferase family 1 protein [Aquificota bacterium]|nr:MAG: glycosyltransferase family 1 protein [Aquificota bacterium]